MEPWVTIMLSIVGSSAIFGFIQFLIQRKDSKSDKLDSISKKIDQVEEKVDKLSSEMKQNDEDLRDSLEANKALTARVRILRGSDEISHNMKHSREWFDQMNEDITFYESYCREHPNFKNNKAVHAIQNVNELYAKVLRDNDFL